MRSVPEEAERLLQREPRIAHLATSVDDRPHVAPVWYRYDDETVEVVTTGRKLENVRANPRVSLSVQADEDGRPRWAVVLRGSAAVIDDDAANERARRRINDRYGAPPDAYAENVLVRIDVASATHWTY